MLLQVVCTGPLTCGVAHLDCTKKFTFCSWCGKVGGCLERGGGDGPCFRR